MTRWLLRFGFDGLPFAGWARQPGRRTIEGEIREGLRRCGVAPDAAGARLEVASRTDRGVSARANALALTSALEGAPLLHALNRISPEIFFSQAAEVPAGFRVREALWREYRYYLPEGIAGMDRWPEWFPWFTEAPIDVRSLARGVAADRPLRRPIHVIELLPLGGGAELRVRAPGFLWGMVRKMVGALVEVGQGRLEPDVLRAALQGRTRLTLPMAPPEPLLLWEVEHGVPWTHSSGRWRRQQIEYCGAERQRARTRAELLRHLPASSG
ncbi:MAG: tRNA pseudouridine synthase A [Thermoplasmata archaeon]